jgi:hypothetical protein
VTPRTGGEGGLGAEPLGIVAGGDQQLAGGVDPDPGQRDQARGRRHERLELGVELVEFGLELPPAPGQGPQGGLGRGRRAGQGPGPHGRTELNERLGLEPERGWRSASGALESTPWRCSAAATRALRAPRRATRRTRIISTWPSRVLGWWRPP